MLERPSFNRRRRTRYELPNQGRYLTFSCHDRLPLFNNDAIKDRFVEHLRESRERFGFRLIAWVVMPEHVHLLLIPDLPEHTVSEIVREMKKRFAREVINRWRELNAPILDRVTAGSGASRFWLRGGGYDRNILGGHELPEKIRYIHENPVRRGLVASATEWSWSSARAYAGDAPHSIPIDFERA